MVIVNHMSLPSAGSYIILFCLPVLDSMQMSMRKLNSHILFCNCGVVAMQSINFCILALGSGQRLLYR